MVIYAELIQKHFLFFAPGYINRYYVSLNLIYLILNTNRKKCTFYYFEVDFYDY